MKQKHIKTIIRYKLFRFEQRIKHHRFFYKLWLRLRGSFIGWKRKLIVTPLVIATIAGIFLLQTKPIDAAWYGSSWKFRKLLNIQESKVSGSGNHTNFPVLVSMTDPDLKAAQSDGDDILFTSADGTTKLDHDIEKFDNTTGELIAWVEVPTLDYNDNTPIYLYYGNAAASNQQNATGTWESTYEGVWHVAEGTGTNADDETTKANDITLSTSSWSAGKIGTGWDGDGSNRIAQGADDADFDFIASENFTVSFWFKSDSTTNPSSNEYVLSKGGNTNIGYFVRASGSGDGAFIFGTEYTGDGTIDDRANSGIDSYDGQWHHLVGVKTGTTKIELFIDGVLTDTDSAITNSTLANAEVLRLGDINNTDTTNEFPGDIDETRIARTNRSADWIATEYANQSNPTGFFTNGDQQSQRTPILHWAFDEGTGTTVNDASAFDNDGTITSATWKTGDACVTDKCLSFDGIDDYVSKSYASDADLDPGSTSFSASLWFKHPTVQGGTDVLLARYSSGGYIIYMNSSGFICFGIDDDGTSFPEDSACSTTRYDNQEWHFLQAIKSGTSSITIYLDGKQAAQDASISATGSISGSSPVLYVGTESPSSNVWTGFIDEVKLYDHARSGTQIQADYTGNGGSVILGAQDQAFLTKNLLGYWNMDESTANSCSGGSNDSCDSSGNDSSLAWVANTTSGVGKFGNGTVYDGDTDETSGNIAGSVSSKRWTISAYFKTSDTQGYIFDTRTNGFALYMDGANTPKIYYENDGAIKDYTYSATVTDNNWHHALLTRTGDNTLAFYIDGQLLTPTALTTDNDISSKTDALSTVHFGNRHGGNIYPLLGSIDEGRLYSRSLSPNEVRSLYEWAPGPTAEWKMDEGTGTSVRDSTTGNITGTIAGSAEWKPGKFGNAVSFDNTDDNISFGDNLDVIDGEDFSVSFWAYRTSAATDGILVKKNGANANQTGYLMQFTTAGRFEAYFADGTDQFQIESNAIITANQWVHVALVFDEDSATNTKTYINGVNRTSSTTGTITDVNSLANALNLKIGSWSNDSFYFNGTLDNLRYYRYVLSEKQIIRDMNADHPSVGTPVGSAVAHWSLDEGYGTTANDQTPNDNDLTLSATSWTNSGKFEKAWNGTGARWMTRTDDSDFDFTETDNFSLSLWFKSDAASAPGTQEYLLSKSESSPGYRIFGQTDGDIVFGIDDDATWTPGDNVGNLGINRYDGNWHHIVAVKTGITRIDLYIDGKLVDSDTSIIETGTLINAVDLFLGDRNGVDGGDELNGDLDEIKIYRAALNADDIKAEYNQGKSQVFGAVSTASDGITVSNDATRAYCPPGNTETNCGTGNPSPIGEWKLDENTGSSASDTSGNSLSGIITDGLWTSGKLGAALSLNGTTSFIDYNDQSTLEFSGASDKFTLEAWVKLASTPAEFATILSKYNGTGNQREYRLYVDNATNAVVLWMSEDGTGAVARSETTAATLTVGIWTHISATVDFATDTYNIYFNGIKQTTSSSGSAITTMHAGSAQFYIGAVEDSSTAPDNFFPGVIDDVKVYNYARTPAQVAWDYNRGGPAGYWQFDECTGTTAYDTSGNGNNGTWNFSDDTYTSAGTCSSGTASHMWNSGTTGKFNAAGAFDGGDSADGDTHVRLPDNVFDTHTQGTIAMWIKPADAAATWENIFSAIEDDNGAYTDYLQFAYEANSDKLAIIIKDNNTVLYYGEYVLSNPTNWHHIAWVNTTSGNTLFVDGIARTLTYTNGSSATDAWFDNVSDNTTAYTIGCGNADGSDSNDCTGGEEFTGLIDDVRVYNYPLNAIQIRKLINDNAAVRFGPSTGQP